MSDMCKTCGRQRAGRHQEMLRGDRAEAAVERVREWYRNTNGGKLHGSHDLWLDALDGTS